MLKKRPIPFLHDCMIGHDVNGAGRALTTNQFDHRLIGIHDRAVRGICRAFYLISLFCKSSSGCYMTFA